MSDISVQVDPNNPNHLIGVSVTFNTIQYITVYLIPYIFFIICIIDY
jgi:hypothetical protein